jgi:hypothetical protein
VSSRFSIAANLIISNSGGWTIKPSNAVTLKLASAPPFPTFSRPRSVCSPRSALNFGITNYVNGSSSSRTGEMSLRRARPAAVALVYSLLSASVVTPVPVSVPVIGPTIRVIAVRLVVVPIIWTAVVGRA